MTQERKAFEIRPEDVIRRPAEGVPGTAPGAAKPSNPLQELRAWAEEIKKLKDLAEDTGILDMLQGFGLPIPGSRGNEPEPEPDKQPAASPGGSWALITQALQLFRAAYGDVTVNVLLEKLKADYGEMKLSEFTRKKGK